jgi:hypothetical protein
MIDHLVYATPDLDASIAYLETRLGVLAEFGGQHPGLGTRNALLSLGERRYLEIIGPDPLQQDHASPRWFGIDALTKPKLVTWAEAAPDLEALRKRARRAGISLGDVSGGKRMRPDGQLLSWQITSPFTVIADGLVPFFIDWGSSAHPSQHAPTGVTLESLRVKHPKPAKLKRAYNILGVDVTVRRGKTASLTAMLDSPNGLVRLR